MQTKATMQTALGMKIYKICSRQEWDSAVRSGIFAGSPVDAADGFIHFSTAVQVRETAARHFTGLADLVLVEFDADELGSNLKWEKSRGGDLFPHLYQELSTDLAQAVYSLPWDGSGHTFPNSIAD